jgi:hypothetical protein
MELERPALGDYRVARVVAAVEPRHDLGVFGQPVYDASLSFITPLGSNYDRGWHRSASWQQDRRRGEMAPPSLLIILRA